MHSLVRCGDGPRASEPPTSAQVVALARGSQHAAARRLCRADAPSCSSPARCGTMRTARQSSGKAGWRLGRAGSRGAAAAARFGVHWCAGLTSPRNACSGLPTLRRAGSLWSSLSRSWAAPTWICAWSTGPTPSSPAARSPTRRSRCNRRGRCSGLGAASCGCGVFGSGACSCPSGTLPPPF